MRRPDKFEYKGKMLSVAELHEISKNGISKQALHYRLLHGMTAEEAITKKVKRKNPVKKEFSCGAKNPLDCLHCPYKIMPCLSWPVMKGEGKYDIYFDDYEDRKHA